MTNNWVLLFKGIILTENVYIRVTCEYAFREILRSLLVQKMQLFSSMQPMKSLLHDYDILSTPGPTDQKCSSFRRISE